MSKRVRDFAEGRMLAIMLAVAVIMGSIAPPDLVRAITQGGNADVAAHAELQVETPEIADNEIEEEVMESEPEGPISVVPIEPETYISARRDVCHGWILPTVRTVNVGQPGFTLTDGIVGEVLCGWIYTSDYIEVVSTGGFNINVLGRYILQYELRRDDMCGRMRWISGEY